MALVTDFLLLAASGAACFYCWNLSTRLKKLTTSKDGFGAGIAALAQSSEEMKKAFETSKAEADQTVSRIEALLADAEEKKQSLSEMMAEYSQMSESIAQQADETTTTYAETLKPVIDDGNDIALKLVTAINDARTAMSELSAQAEMLEAPAEEDPEDIEASSPEEVEEEDTAIAEELDEEELSAESEENEEDEDDYFDLDSIEVEPPTSAAARAAQSRKKAAGA